MSFYMKLAWRNIFRNKRRTYIAGIAIGIGLASLIFYDAIMIGMKENMIKSATSSFLGEAQIHQKDFRITQEVEKTIQNFEGVKNDLKKEEIVDKFTFRTLSFSMITSPANVNSIILFGIEPEKEKFISKIDDAIKEGNFFKGDHEREIVIGSKLADTLEVSLDDRIVITVSQAETGDLSQEMFRISGIYHFNVKEMDGGMAFIRLQKAQEMLGLGTDVHEIAIKFNNLDYASQEDLPFWKKYTRDNNEVTSWEALLPDLKAVFDLTGFFTFIIGLILFVIIAFGIINTLFMSLYERLFEFGVLRAVGTRPSGVRKLIIFEAGALSILSIILGTLLGFLIILILMKTGIDYRGIEFAGAIFYEMLYPVLHIRQFIIFPAAVFIFTMITGLYPATVAARMSITNALRKSL